MANEQNLIHVQPGQVLNPNGRPKGSKNLSTIIKELEDDEFDWSIMPTKQKDAVKKLGSPWRAITYAAAANALKGDMRAAEWLRKAGYGDKIDLTNNGDKFEPVVVRIINESQRDTDTE